MQAVNTKVIPWLCVLAKSIFWQAAGEVIVGADAHLEILLVKAAAYSRHSASLNGRILAQTACTLQMAVITTLTVCLSKLLG
jgi:predicted acyltransferase (DUF342 family)